jgi:hypothetical protein
MHRLLLLVYVLLVITGCGGSKSDFERAFQIRMPQGLVVEHEYFSKNWRYTSFSYYAVLGGERPAFLALVTQLGLHSATQHVYIFSGPLPETSQWWKPPWNEVNSPDRWGLDQMDAEGGIHTTVVAHYTDQRIYLWKVKVYGVGHEDRRGAWLLPITI